MCIVKAETLDSRNRIVEKESVQTNVGIEFLQHQRLFSSCDIQPENSNKEQSNECQFEECVRYLNRENKETLAVTRILDNISSMMQLDLNSTCWAGDCGISKSRNGRKTYFEGLGTVASDAM